MIKISYNGAYRASRKVTNINADGMPVTTNVPYTGHSYLVDCDTTEDFQAYKDAVEQKGTEFEREMPIDEKSGKPLYYPRAGVNHGAKAILEISAKGNLYVATDDETTLMNDLLAGETDAFIKQEIARDIAQSRLAKVRADIKAIKELKALNAQKATAQPASSKKASAKLD